MTCDAGVTDTAARDAAVTTTADNKSSIDYEIIIVVRQGNVVRFENKVRVPHLEGTNGDGI